MTTTVADLVTLMNQLAAPELAEEWDNCGLQAGRLDQEVCSIWVALDPSLEVVEAACNQGVDLLITHHPLFISSLKSLDFSSFPGKIIELAARQGLSIFSAHTNLDSATGGLNDICAQRLGLTNLEVLAPVAGARYCKLAFFVPVEHEQKMLGVLDETRAGTVGHYSSCSFSVSGTGRFRPSGEASPFVGTSGEMTSVAEVRLETIVEKCDLGGVVALIKKHHPYETMAYDVFPLEEGNVVARQGLGRVGELLSEQPLASLVDTIKKQFGAEMVRVAGDLEMPVKKVAVCSGSGSGLMKEFLASEAQVFVSGDLKYHDGRDACEQGRALVDVGHFETEVLVVEELVKKLGKMVAERGLEVEIAGYRSEKSPFVFL